MPQKSKTRSRSGRSSQRSGSSRGVTRNSGRSSQRMPGRASRSKSPHMKTPSKSSRGRSERSDSGKQAMKLNPQDRVEVEIQPVSEREFVEDVQQEEQHQGG